MAQRQSLKVAANLRISVSMRIVGSFGSKWVAVSSGVDCHAYQFLEPNMQIDHNVICQLRFKCTELWEGLMPIQGDSTKRFCAVCKSLVYLTTSYEELETNISAKRCVVLYLKEAERPELEVMGFFEPTLPGTLDPIFTRPIEEIELAQVSLDMLRANNVQLVGDLVQCGQSQLVEQFGADEHQLYEIVETLASRGLTIDMVLENWELLSARYR